MKATVCFITMLIMVFSLSARRGEYPLQITTEYRPFYNVLRVASFDTQAPENQPVFFRIRVNNTSSETFITPYLYFSLKMNSTYLIDEGTNTRYLSQIPPGILPPFTNREIFTETDLGLFSGVDISVDDILNRIPGLRDVVLNTGLFPDGSYTFVLQFKDSITNTEISPPVHISFEVRNPSGIFLISPGIALGGRIPDISSSPASFVWSSNLARFPENPFTLIVKEFDDPSLLSSDFVETGGQVIAEVVIPDVNYFSDYIPLQEGRYYAWQVSTEILDPTVATQPVIRSPYYVFRYSTDSAFDNKVAVDAIRTYLYSLNIQWITELLNTGYNPTGVLNYDGAVWSGDGAVNLLNDIGSRQVVETRLTD